MDKLVRNKTSIKVINHTTIIIEKLEFNITSVLNSSESIHVECLDQGLECNEFNTG